MESMLFVGPMDLKPCNLPGRFANELYYLNVDAYRWHTGGLPRAGTNLEFLFEFAGSGFPQVEILTYPLLEDTIAGKKDRQIRKLDALKADHQRMRTQVCAYPNTPAPPDLTPALTWEETNAGDEIVWGAIAISMAFLNAEWIQTLRTFPVMRIDDPRPEPDIAEMNMPDWLPYTRGYKYS